jgi:serine/threonine protein kinase
MSEVFAALDTKNNGKKVAVKLFTKGSFEDDILREAFDREIRALRDLKHSNIVELIDSGEDNLLSPSIECQRASSQNLPSGVGFPRRRTSLPVESEPTDVTLDHEIF